VTRIGLSVSNPGSSDSTRLRGGGPSCHEREREREGERVSIICIIHTSIRSHQPHVRLQTLYAVLLPISTGSTDNTALAVRHDNIQAHTLCLSVCPTSQLPSRMISASTSVLALPPDRLLRRSGCHNGRVTSVPSFSRTVEIREQTAERIFVQFTTYRRLTDIVTGTV